MPSSEAQKNHTGHDYEKYLKANSTFWAKNKKKTKHDVQQSQKKVNSQPMRKHQVTLACGPYVENIVSPRIFSLMLTLNRSERNQLGKNMGLVNLNLK